MLSDVKWGGQQVNRITAALLWSQSRGQGNTDIVLLYDSRMKQSGKVGSKIKIPGEDSMILFFF